MSVKPRWWCIEHECKHYNVHRVHHGSVKSTEYCQHEDILQSDKCVNPTLGVDMKDMVMCPVLYDAKSGIK